MKSTKNFFSFFISKFYDNIKFNHSFAFKTKIFFERSTKYRQTMDNLGNVYRNSKWTDLKIQNIKSSHLLKFLRINLIIFLLFISIYAIVFRYNPSFLYSITSEVSFIWLTLSELLNYISVIAMGLILNLYILILSTYSRLISNFNNLHVPSDNNLSSLSLSSNFSKSTDNIFAQPNNLTFKGKSNVKSELLLLSKLFCSKKELDFISSSAVILDSKDIRLSEDYEISFILKNSANTPRLSKSFLSLESEFKLENINIEFSKSKSTDSSIKKGATNPFLSHILESTIESTLGVASANRWLLKMLPFSENLSINNSYFNKVKENLANPTSEFSSINRNIWLANTDVSGAYSSLSSSKLLDNSNINYFDASQLWNQKRNYLMLTTKHSETKPISNFISVVNADTSHSIYNNISDTINMDYQLYKILFSTDKLCPSTLSNAAELQYKNIYLSGLSLNVWNSSDKVFLSSLCSSDSSLDKRRANYTYCEYSDLYTNLS